MSQEVNALVTSHDSPGFGLTQRSTKLQDYSFQYNGQLGRIILESQVELLSPKSEGDKEPEESTGVKTKMEKDIILVGHSMGCISTAYEVVNNPKSIVGLVFIAPALMAPKIKNSASSQNIKKSEPEKAVEAQIGTRLSSVSKFIVKSLLKSIAGLVAWVSQPFLALTLRWAVRSADFWKNGLSRAYHNKDLVDRRALFSYRYVLKVHLDHLILQWCVQYL